MLIRLVNDIDKSKLLRSSWLSDFPDDVIADAATCATLRTVEDGALLHERGAEADGLYTIASGSVRFTRTTADGHATTIAVLDAPSWFGEISLFDGLPRSHDGFAIGPTTVLFHARADFKRLLGAYPAIYERFAKMLSLRLHATFDLVEEAAVAPLQQRLARRLLELAQLRPSAMNAATNTRGREVPLTQEELGHLLGKSRQSISKLLHTWEQSGLIQTKYGRISIKQPDALRVVAFPDLAASSARKSSPAGRSAARHSKETT
jgi:CRP/FNR family transcriptional regulator, cyclic AMP receptor protein